MDRILVIEHDGALRKVLQRLFSSEGYEVYVVPGAVAGVEMLRQRPTVVVLDLPYAESSGCDLCRKIANLILGLPLVILSASSDVADKVRLLESGANDCVTIPFSPRELVDRLRSLRQAASGCSTISRSEWNRYHSQPESERCRRQISRTAPEQAAIR